MITGTLHLLKAMVNSLSGELVWPKMLQTLCNGIMRLGTVGNRLACRWFAGIAQERQCQLLN